MLLLLLLLLLKNQWKCYFTDTHMILEENRSVWSTSPDDTVTRTVCFLSLLSLSCVSRQPKVCLIDFLSSLLLCLSAARERGALDLASSESHYKYRRQMFARRNFTPSPVRRSTHSYSLPWLIVHTCWWLHWFLWCDCHMIFTGNRRHIVIMPPILYLN